MHPHLFPFAAGLVLGAPLAAQDLPLQDLQRLFPRIHSIHGAELVDLDGDSDLDAGLLLEDGVLLVRRGANGRFTADAGVLPGTDPFLAGNAPLRFFDADGDGDHDLFLARHEQDVLQLNDGAGGFADASGSVPAGPDFPEDADVGDVDGDGDLDLLLLESGSATWLYRNDGAAGFTGIPTGGAVASALALADLDGDGDLDGMTANVGTCSGFGCVASKAYVWTGNGAGGFAHTQLSSVETFGDDVQLGDLDGDGDVDAVLASRQLVETAVIENQGGGAFAQHAGALPAAPGTAVDAALLDVDGDGDLDVFLAGEDAKGMSDDKLLRHDGGFAFADVTASSPASCCSSERVAAGDVEGDGDVDLLVVGFWPRLFLGDAGGFLVDVTPVESVVEGFERLVLADLEGDGLLDGIGATGHELLELRNDGAGDLVETSVLATYPGGAGFASAAAGDVDGDGDVDVFGGILHSPDVLLLSDGAGGFADASAQLGTPADHHTADALLADVDGDGDLDLVTASGDAGWSSGWLSKLLRNDGSGTFTDGGLPSPQRAADVEAADLDLDGDLDLVLAGGITTVMKQTATGWSSTTLPIAWDSLCVAIGDLNGDAFPDAVFGRESEQAQAYWNNGTGTLVLHQHFGAKAVVADAAIADLDADGDSEVLLGGATCGLWHHVASNLVEVTPPELVGVFSVDTVAAADLDLDGDLDALFAGGIVLWNTTRHTAWGTPLSLGDPFEMELYGTPGDTWVLAWSTVPALLPLAPYGVLKIAPPIHISNSGLIGGGGSATYLTAVPNLPSLVGAALSWQSVVGPPFVFTNRTTTVIRDL